MPTFHVATVILMFIITMACSCSNRSGPNAAPQTVSRNDEFQYSFGSFYSASGSHDVFMVSIQPSSTGPIAWIKEQPIDINVETKTSVIEKCGRPDTTKDDLLGYKPVRGWGLAGLVYLNKDRIDSITIAEEGGVSLHHNSELLTFPFSRTDLFRVFGEPKKTILSP